MTEGSRSDVASETAETLVISANAFWNIANFRGGLVTALVEREYRVVVAAPDADHQWAVKRGADAVDVSIDRSGLNPVRDVRLVLQYRKILRRCGAGTFVSFTAKPNIYGAMAARMRRIAALPNVSGLGTAFMADGLLAKFVGWLYRVAFRHCPIVFFQNPDDRDLFVERKIIRFEQARLVPGSGVDLDHFSPLPDAADGNIRFLFIGRLLGDKGIREYVEAARNSRKRHPDWSFQLLGPIDEGNRTGIHKEELQQWITEGAVEYLGETEDVRPFIARATAVVLPSYREGLPRSLLEAAAMARPLIGSDVPGNREIVQPDVNGLLCEPRNSISLSEAIEHMGTMDPLKRLSMGQAGRALVEQSYSERRVIDAYLAAIAQLQRQSRV